MGFSENSEKRLLMGCPRSASMTRLATLVSKGVMLSWRHASCSMTGTGKTSGLQHVRVVIHGNLHRSYRPILAENRDCTVKAWTM